VLNFQFLVNGRTKFILSCYDLPQFVQILVLLALAVVVVRYLEWSSDANKAEFLSSAQPAVSDRNHLPQSSTSLEQVKARASCNRKVWWTGP